MMLWLLKELRFVAVNSQYLLSPSFKKTPPPQKKKVRFPECLHTDPVLRLHLEQGTLFYTPTACPSPLKTRDEQRHDIPAEIHDTLIQYKKQWKVGQVKTPFTS